MKIGVKRMKVLNEKMFCIKRDKRNSLNFLKTLWFRIKKQREKVNFLIKINF